MMQLKNRVKTGLRYVTAFNIFNKFLTFLTTVFLARILFPEDFGMIALAFLVIGAISMFNNFGLAEAMIQSRKDTKKVYATCFLLSIAFSMIAITASFLLAGPISVFYQKPGLSILIRLLSLTFLIDALALMPSTILEKNLEFSRKIIPETAPIVIYALLSVYLAMAGWGYWSMALAHIASRAIYTSSLWVIRPWRPKIVFDLKNIRYVLGFGKEMVMVSLLLFMLTQGDNALVGKVLGVETLRFYVLAYMLTSLTATNFVNIVSRVTLPAFAKIQKNREILKNAYLKVLKYVYLLAIPSSAGLMIVSREITLAFYGQKWTPMIWPVVILAIFGLCRAISSSSGSLFIAVGRPDILRKITMVQLAVMVVTIYPLTRWYGIIGTSISVTFAHVVVMAIIFSKTSRITGASLYELLAAGKIPFAASLVMAGALILAKLLIFSKTLLINTLVLVLLGAAAYFAAIYALDKAYLKNMVSELI